MYLLRPEGRPSDRHDLKGHSLLEAKMSAAILYAGVAFDKDPPCAYVIFNPEGGLAYRFPETAA